MEAENTNASLDKQIGEMCKTLSLLHEGIRKECAEEVRGIFGSDSRYTEKLVALVKEFRELVCLAGEREERQFRETQRQIMYEEMERFNERLEGEGAAGRINVHPQFPRPERETVPGLPLHLRPVA